MSDYNANAAVWLVEIVAYDSDIATTRTLRYATHGFVTGAGETPASTFYDARVVQPLQINRTLFSPSATKGRSTVGFGDTILANGDGALDSFVHYGFDGRTITIRRGPEGGAYPSDFPAVFVGTMSGVEVTQEIVMVKIRDRQADVEIPLQTTKYAGSGLGTLEGTADSIKGKPKPVCYGSVSNITPVCVETAKLIYQVADAAVSDITNVYDRGVALTDGGTYASTAALLDNAGAPAAGAYKIYTGAEGSYFRLGGSPDGLVTADVLQGAAAANRTVGQIFATILDERAGKTTGDWNATDITDLDTADNSVIGFWTDAETQIASVLDQVASSVGASWFVDRDGVFRIKQFTAPSGSAVATFTANDIVGKLRRVQSNDQGQGIPTYQTIVRYDRNFTVQQTDLAAGVTDARRAYLAAGWREATDTDAAVQTSHLLAVQNVDDTLLTVEADAVAEAERRQTLRGVRRDVFQFTVDIDDTSDLVELNDVIELSHDRYELGVVGDETGSPFRVIGIQTDAKQRRTTFTVWGSPEGRSNMVTDTGALAATDTGDYGLVSAA